MPKTKSLLLSLEQVPEPVTRRAKEIVKSDICERCGARIHLVSTGLHYKWVTDPNRPVTFHCGHDPAKPVLGHAPQEALCG